LIAGDYGRLFLAVRLRPRLQRNDSKLLDAAAPALRPLLHDPDHPVLAEENPQVPPDRLYVRAHSLGKFARADQGHAVFHLP